MSFIENWTFNRVWSIRFNLLFPCLNWLRVVLFVWVWSIGQKDLFKTALFHAEKLIIAVIVRLYLHFCVLVNQVVFPKSYWIRVNLKLVNWPLDEMIQVELRVNLEVMEMKWESLLSRYQEQLLHYTMLFNLVPREYILLRFSLLHRGYN